MLDPAALAQLPPAIAAAVPQGLADALHDVFVTALPFVLLAFVATLRIKAPVAEDDVRRADAGQEVLDELNQSSAGGEHFPVD